MIEKLSTLWKFKVTPVKVPSGNWLIIDLWEIGGEGRLKSWNIKSTNVEGYTAHMNSLTDELCEGFFPRPKLTKEQRKALKASQ